MKSRYILGISLLAFLVACSPPPEKNEIEYLTIHELCACGEITKEKIQYFLDLGVDINHKNASGDTPLSLALKANKNVDEIQCLIELGGDESIDRGLVQAIRNSNIDIIELLIGNENINRTIIQGRESSDSPFYWLELEEFIESKEGRKLIDRAKALQAKQASRIEKLGKNVFEGLDNSGEMYAESVESFNRSDAYITLRTYQKWKQTPPHCEGNKSPLLIAAECSTVEVATYLIQSGANKLDDALLTASKTPNKAMIELLVRANLGDVSCTDECGKTPLHMAALYWGTPETISLLIDNGCSVNAVDDTGFTPLDYYLINKGGYRRNHKVLKILLDAGAIREGVNDWFQRKQGSNIPSEEETAATVSNVRLLMDNGKLSTDKGEGLIKMFQEYGEIIPVADTGYEIYKPTPYQWQSPCKLGWKPEATTFDEFTKSKEFLVGNREFLVLDKKETQIESILLNRMSPEFDKKGIPLKFIATNESFVDELLELEMRAIFNIDSELRREFLENSLSELNMLPYIVCADATFGKDNISEEQFQIVKEKMVVESLNTTWDSAIANARNIMADWFAEFEITDFNLSQPRVLTNGKNHITFLLNNGVEFNTTDNQEYALYIVITMTMLRIEEKVLFVYTYCDSNDHASFKDFNDWLDETILNIQ